MYCMLLANLKTVQIKSSGQLVQAITKFTMFTCVWFVPWTMVSLEVTNSYCTGLAENVKFYLTVQPLKNF